MLCSMLAIYLLSLASFVTAQDKSLCAVKRAFEAANIPSTLGVAFNPRFLLEVSFPQTTVNLITLQSGVLHIPRNATVEPPSYEVIGHAGHGPFVIVMLDPDVPTPQEPTLSQIRHFFGTDFFAERGKGRLQTVHSLVNKTAALTQCFQPTPIPESDPHRYIFLLYKQPLGFEEQSLVTPSTPITVFNLSLFAELTGLEAPIAGSFMFVAPDLAIGP